MLKIRQNVDCKMKKHKCREALTSFVDNIHPGRGWRCAVEKPGQETITKAVKDAFPELNAINTLNAIIGLHSSVMGICLIQIGCIKEVGSKLHFNNEGCDVLRHDAQVRFALKNSITRIK